jgi:hypothetical protein
MHIAWCSQAEPDDEDGPCTVAYTMSAPGLPTTDGRRIFVLATAEWPKPGQDLPVTVDARRPDRLTVHWQRRRRLREGQAVTGRGAPFTVAAGARSAT